MIIRTIFRTIAATSVLMAAVLSVGSQSGGGFEITEAVVAGGGGSSSNGNTTAASTTGQSLAAGAIGSGNFGITSGFWNYISLAPTAASVSISGRVVDTAGGGVANAILYMQTKEGSVFISRSSPLGYYQFESVEAGQTVLISVQARRYTYAPRTVLVADEITDLDFLPEP
jgi:hypothetical protein